MKSGITIEKSNPHYPHIHIVCDGKYYLCKDDNDMFVWRPVEDIAHNDLVTIPMLGLRKVNEPFHPCLCVD